MRYKIFVITSIVLSALSCTKKNTDGQIKFLVPWPTEHGTYELRVVPVHSLKDKISVSGDAAKLYIEPRLMDDGLRGDPPAAKFSETNEGVFVPVDFLSSQLAGLYAHVEKLWDLDKTFGIDHLIEHPRKYGIKAKVFRDGVGEPIKNNATYVSQGDSTLMMPYDGSANVADKQLPIALNGGVIAHEHFHALFNALMGEVIRVPEPQSNLMGCDAFDNASLDSTKAETLMKIGFADIVQEPKVLIHNLLVMRGINEGLADFWAWVYTGDDLFIAHSLPEIGKRRTLITKAGGEDLVTTKEFYERANQYPDQVRISLSYELGSQIARIVRRLGARMIQTQGFKGEIDTSIFENRIEIGKLVLAAMPELKKDFEKSISESLALETTAFNDAFFSNELKKKFDPLECAEVEKALTQSKRESFNQKNCIK